MQPCSRPVAGRVEGVIAANSLGNRSGEDKRDDWGQPFAVSRCL